VEPGAGGLEKYWYLEKNTWHVFGRVTDIRGDPLREVTVRVGIGSINDEPRVLKTNLKGEFSTEYSLDANAFRKLNVKVVASMSGYALAREAADYTLDGKTSGIHLVLRETKEDPDQLSMAALIERLGPRLREEAAKQPGVEPDRKEFVRGCEELLDRHNAVGAVAPLSRVVERAASCVPCRLLLSLALLDSGSWAGGTRQLQEATKLNEAAAAKQPEPGLIGGVLDAWRGDAGAAAGSFLKALEIDPNHALGLQEMGRVLVAQKNWEAAEQYLERALRAGAGAEIRLLRVRALLGVGDVVEADREMNQYVGGRDVKTLPLEARTLYLQVQERLELVPFAKVKSVISESPRELVKGMPELAGLEVAPNQDALELVLKKTGEGVEAFFRNFPNTVSVEQIHQERLGKDGKVKSSLDQEFQYLLLAHAEKWGLGVDEHRSTARGNIAGLHGLNQGLMLTSGFASVSLHFHPAYRDGATFRYLGRQRINGEDVHVVAFAQKPATARMTQRFISDEGSAVLLLQGLAWIDPTTFQIVRLHTDLLAPQSKVRLQRQTTEIQFKEVSFKEVARALWLPEEVAVTVDWRGRIYRNQHRYSDFKLFNVEAKEERKTPIAPTPETQGQAR
jgi:tetratricopeptide (TPR) repeat protein